MVNDTPFTPCNYLNLKKFISNQNCIETPNKVLNVHLQGGSNYRNFALR